MPNEDTANFDSEHNAPAIGITTASGEYKNAQGSEDGILKVVLTDETGVPATSGGGLTLEETADAVNDGVTSALITNPFDFEDPIVLASAIGQLFSAVNLIALAQPAGTPGTALTAIKEAIDGVASIPYYIKLDGVGLTSFTIPANSFRDVSVSVVGTSSYTIELTDMATASPVTTEELSGTYELTESGKKLGPATLVTWVSGIVIISALG